MSVVGMLRERVHQAIGPMINPGRRIALVDFPNHSNVGDSAIWSGELAFLRERGIQSPDYVCDGLTYNRARMLRTIGKDGLILLHGGGNLGDIWPWHQRLRERVITEFPDHEIIQLPQTIYFEREETLDRARQVFNAHPRLTLFARSEQSLEFARREFRAPAHLAPDTAFFIRVPNLGIQPDQEVLWLARIDRETAGLAPPGAPGILRMDWLDEGHSFAQWLNYQARRPLHTARRPVRAALSLLWTPAFCEKLAWERVVRGMRILRRGDTIITDRLHGHILCEILGIPHVMRSNKYPKIRNFWETWTRASTLAHWADSDEEAIEIARRIGHRPPQSG